jgi:hypothetical protein
MTPTTFLNILPKKTIKNSKLFQVKQIWLQVLFDTFFHFSEGGQIFWKSTIPIIEKKLVL